MNVKELPLTSYKSDGQQVFRVSSADLHKNLKVVTDLLTEGHFIEITKHKRKIGLIVPY
ncbi:hypothetical protein [Piscirickettsia litoralis]|uniref:hypothetical protein n=1 Tax=Piscirickettsia litoralis TaxID=1891921 RepID=UPI001913B9C7|nr:hypothetical protein [Piscirickettsia litoralis]